MASERIELAAHAVKRTALPVGLWSRARASIARVVRRFGDNVVRMVDGFMAHGWTGRMFLGNFALGIVATGLAWTGWLGTALAGSWPLLLAMLVQWRFLAATARFGRYTRVASAVMCAVMVVLSIYLMTTGLSQRLFALFLAEAVFMLQCFLYFASPSYRVRAEEYRASLGGDRASSPD